MNKNTIVVTGGAGFVGTNLIKFLLKKTKYKIISIDNYSSGKKKNHIKNKKIKYLNGKTVNISNLISRPESIKTIFILENLQEYIKAFLR